MSVESLHARLLGATLLCLLPAASTLAQQAPQVTPRDLRPETPPKPAVVLPQQPARSAPPANADKLFVTLGDAVVQGGFPEFADETERLIAPLRGQRISVADFYSLADDIEALYRAAGYPLVRVVIPPQSLLDNASLQLIVLDGFVERLNLDAVPPAARKQVERILQPLVGQRRLKDDALEKALTLAGRVHGLTLRSALGAGFEPGGTVLVLQGLLDGVVGSLSSDNRQSDSIGPWQMTAQLRTNQLLGMGEQAYLYVSGGYPLGHAFETDARRRVAGAGMIVPLAANGLSLNPEITVSDSKPRPVFFALASRSQLRRASLRLVYPAIVSRRQELTLTAVAEASRQVDTLTYFNFIQDLDRLRVLRLSADWSGAVGDGQMRAGATVSQGTSKFGGRSRAEIAASEVPMSRAGAGPSYTKLEANLSYDLGLPWGMQSRSMLRGQAPLRGVLPSAETFGMDGEDGVSALTAGQLSDDGGWVARQEVSRPVRLPGAVSLAPYAYGAYAHLHTRLAVERAGHAEAYGIGLRTSWRNTSLSGEFGRGRVSPDGRYETQAFFKAQVQF